MKIWILIISFLFTSLIYGQNSKQLIDQSIVYLKNKDNLKFDQIRDRVWAAFLKENIPYYNNAIENIKKKQYPDAFKNLDSIISEDYFIDTILTDKNFSALHHMEGWKKFTNQIKAKKSKYNNDIRLKLLDVQNKDQSIRLIYQELKKTYTDDSDLVKSASEKMKKIDLESVDIVTKIIDKYGWLGKDKIGKEANETLFLGIQHIDDLVVQSKYLPAIKDAVKKGNAEPWHLAFLTDRILMNQGKKQIYGTQKIITKNPETSYIIPLENPEKVDELRKEIGLDPLNDDLQEDGLSWNLEDYKKDLPRIEKLYKERVEKLPINKG
ncbi:hypothetical protein HZP39_03080 [Elizabethkingia anophelis]|uniref:DUF6624 domain-containing protein n=1 Tax=Elizabethkingia TaxID=308865 RepID=UPI00077E9A33|nr:MULTISPECIES: DUF6624 domain-containing protein [Elizabethkingia]AMR40472.1 hypothetical protein A2T74_03430 [Elizabethkingia anophelis]AMX47106.1 hypothetical protein A4C56_03430 [Elizabethkingia anophelis]AMX50568.1 hypothetical protein A2T72_03430 [Elizabethkingia anophelis]AMX53958.1 hypothetical protein A2T59_03430 [Elizabethkingia anophelis]EGT4345880.1 hypothetical protein [Elizabethkingia anophelis]